MGIFLDFQEAFDTVYYYILLNKLYWYVIRGIAHEWFVRYLSSHQRPVVYNGDKSRVSITEYKLHS